MLNYTNIEIKNSIQPMSVAIGVGLKSSLSHCKLLIKNNTVYTKDHSNKYDLIVGTTRNDGIGYIFTPVEKYLTIEQFSCTNVTVFYHRILFEYIKYVHNYWND